MALFDAKARGRQPGEQAASRLEHIAFRIDLADLAAEKARLQRVPVHPLSLALFRDPEQNMIELVADDPSVVG